MRRTKKMVYVDAIRLAINDNEAIKALDDYARAVLHEKHKNKPRGKFMFKKDDGYIKACVEENDKAAELVEELNAEATKYGNIYV